MSDFNVGETVVVTARIDNFGCEGIIESIDESKSEPIKVAFAEDTRADDDYSGLNFVPNVPQELKMDYALSNSFGFGGTNASLLFARL